MTTLDVFDSIRTKRTRETRLYTVIVFDDMPRGAVVEQILGVEVDPLPEEVLDTLGSTYELLDVLPFESWSINSEPFTDRDGSVYPAGTCMQGTVAGGNDGYIYTIRVAYKRSDDPGPHEATVLLRVRDQLMPDD